MIFDQTQLKNLKSQTISLSEALEESTEPRVICNASHTVIYANKAWSNICGYQQHELAYKNLSALQGPWSDKENIHQMMHNLRSEGYSKAELVNYRKSGEPFLCKVDIEPIVGEDRYGNFIISYYLARVSNIEPVTLARIRERAKGSEEMKEVSDSYDWIKKHDSPRHNFELDEGETLKAATSACFFDNECKKGEFSSSWELSEEKVEKGVGEEKEKEKEDVTLIAAKEEVCSWEGKRNSTGYFSWCKQEDKTEAKPQDAIDIWWIEGSRNKRCRLNDQ